MYVVQGAGDAGRYIASLVLAKFVDNYLKRIYLHIMADYNEEKVDEIVLALLHLTSFSEGGSVRAWKSHDWDALDRLHEKGLISDQKARPSPFC